MIPPQRGSVRSLVVDAAAMVDVLTGQPGHERLIAVLLHDLVALHAPAFLDLEVVSATRRLELDDRITAQRADDLLDDFAEFGLTRHALSPLTGRVWSLREWTRVADGYYVSLAQALGAPLLTRDLRLARAVRDRDAVEVVELDER